MSTSVARLSPSGSEWRIDDNARLHLVPKPGTVDNERKRETLKIIEDYARFIGMLIKIPGAKVTKHMGELYIRVTLNHTITDPMTDEELKLEGGYVVPMHMPLGLANRDIRTYYKRKGFFDYHRSNKNV